MKRTKQSNNNLLVLIIEVSLTLSICLGIAYNTYREIHIQADNYAIEVKNNYHALSNDYIRSFEVIKMESIEKIKEGLSFEEMQNWLLSRDDIYSNAIGEDVYDGFAFTYKGGYVHSWNYGDYTNYVAASRPWYQIASKAEGKVAIVAPYVTYLSNSDFIEDYDILRMSIVQKYDDEIYFDFDLNVREINALLSEKTTLYDGTMSVLYDKDGYILSSNNEKLYGHNINISDKEITKEMSNVFNKIKIKDGFKLELIDGKLKMVYKYIDDEGKTLCMLVPFQEVFIKKFLFVLILALVLIGIETFYYIQNKKYLKYLEQANNTKTEFLSRMSHELRTPLNALSGYSTLLKDDISSNNPNKEKQLLNLSYIDRACNYLLRIISDILDIQTTRFNKSKINKEEVNVVSYIENIIEMINLEAKEKNINFTYNQLTKMADTYVLDGVRFQQILLNVLHNAIKFTNKGGEVILQVKDEIIDDNTSLLRFIISDTGIGMSKEFVDNKLFTNFAQEHQANDSPYEGCGIGLFISKELLDLMDGTIECISEKGVGSTFTITLTTKYFNKKIKRRKRNIPTYDLSGIKVLMCEDNLMNQDMEKRVLEKMHCLVDIADDGQIGLQKYLDSEIGYYDIILMDIRMPNLDGWKCTRAIREANRKDAKSIPIIAISANAFEEDINESINSGMNEHLSKPVNVKILYEVINKYCKKE